MAPIAQCKKNSKKDTFDRLSVWVPNKQSRGDFLNIFSYSQKLTFKKIQYFLICKPSYSLNMR